MLNAIAGSRTVQGPERAQTQTNISMVHLIKVTCASSCPSRWTSPYLLNRIIQMASLGTDERMVWIYLRHILAQFDTSLGYSSHLSWASQGTLQGAVARHMYSVQLYPSIQSPEIYDIYVDHGIHTPIAVSHKSLPKSRRTK
jgi:hypothetical protein